jgi:acyl carrier protein
MKQALADMQLPHSEIDDGNARAASSRAGDVAETNAVAYASDTDAGAFRSIDCEPNPLWDLASLYMVTRMKPIPIDLIQMIRGKMSASLSRTKAAEFSLETPLEDLGLDSLDRLTLLFEIEEHFNVAIPDTTASQMKCGADILAYFSSSQHP